MPSFAMPWRLLGTLTVLNQIRFVWNFVFVKFFSLSENVCHRFSKNASEKWFPPHFFTEWFHNKIHNLRIKMFYQNHRHNFVLYYLIFVWVKFHVNIIRFTQLGAHKSEECFSKNYQITFIALQTSFNFPCMLQIVLEKGYP